LSPPQQTGQLYLRFRWIEINLASRQIDAFARTASEVAGKLKTCRRSYETNVLSGPKKLFQRLLRIISAMRAWCAKPARVKPLRINRFH
jgi:predicted acylesterase/phospholipase RssA